MFRYLIYGNCISTDISFSQLINEHMRQPDVYVKRGEISESVLVASTTKSFEFGVKHSWLSNKTMWMEVIEGTYIRYKAKSNADMQYLRSYILGFGLSMLFMQRQMPALHCSVVYREDETILIAGESGAGKSTITEGLLRAGYSFMADDMTIIENHETDGVFAYPAFPYRKLCRDAVISAGYSPEELLYVDDQKDKFLVPYTGVFSTEPRRISKLVMLTIRQDGGNTVIVRQVKGAAQLQLVYGNLFLRKLLAMRPRSPVLMQVCLEIAASVPCYIIARPANGDTTKQIIQMLCNKEIYDTAL